MKAYAIGAKSAAWLEADIRFTADDVPVILHDADLDRTTNGTGPVSGYTFALTVRADSPCKRFNE